MILLHDQKIAIMTPPKCATNTLHAALRRKRWNGETFVGHSTLGGHTFDRHVNIWPHEVRRYKKVVAVRNPYNRLVSLYLHLATREAGHGNKSPNFKTFAEQVVADSPELQGWFKWNLTKWLKGADDKEIEIDDVIHVENLKDDLARIKLPVVSLPFLNKNYRAQQYDAFFDPEILAAVLPWTQPDCERFGYGFGPEASPL
jgi:hypothetical protein